VAAYLAAERASSFGMMLEYWVCQFHIVLQHVGEKQKNDQTEFIQG